MFPRDRSILGPLLFNVFLNDIFYFVKKCGLCNYADDNTVTYSHPDPLETKKVLTSESEDVLILTTYRLILESSRPFSWVKEGMVTVTALQYRIIQSNVKIQSNFWVLL